MSVPEIFYRIRQLSKGIIEEKFGHKFEFRPEEIGSVGSILNIETGHFAKLQHSISLFGVDFDFNDLAGTDWHKDFFSGNSFDLLFYKKINILKNPGLSAKSVWEINRLQFLTGICTNYKLSGNKADLDLFVQIIKSWNEQNPFLQGVNWYSNIEVNLRLITWFLSWEILDADKLMSDDKEFREFAAGIWLPLIKKHCIYSFENPSRYSSANNHLISEYAGLFIASSKWKFRDSEKWKRYSQKGLETEIIKQHSAQGVNKEEAAEYIQFITDFFLLAYIVGEKSGSPFSDKFRQRLYKIFCYIYDLLDCNGNFPKYGDEDDGKCFIFDYDEGFNNFQSLLTSGAILFNNPDFKSRSNGFDIKNHFLLGAAAKMTFDSIDGTEKPVVSKFYSEEGHFFFRKRDKSGEIYLHFNAAPLGFLSIAAHGHSDALSFILNVDGQAFFVDPGTFTYHTDQEWRRYFIGAIAHNTIRINGMNQALSGGPTLWITKYKTSILDQKSGSDSDIVRATHDGYSKVGASHIRKITFHRMLNEFHIDDTIIVANKTKLDIEIPFHLHPSVRVSQISENDFKLTCDNIRDTFFAFDSKLHPSIIHGETNPQILGWYSGSFLKKEATNVIYCKTQIEQTETFKFIIKIK
jgi:hypothetical protein